MALLGKDAEAFEKRKQDTLKRLHDNPKTSGQVAMSLLSAAMKPSTLGYFTGENMTTLNARCMRLAGQTTLIGNTVFSFGFDGISRTPHVGNNILDYEVLVTRNGVERLDENCQVVSDHLDADLMKAQREMMPSSEPTNAPIPLEQLMQESQVEPPAPAAVEAMEAAPPDLVVPEPTTQLDPPTELPAAEEMKGDDKKSRRNPKK